MNANTSRQTDRRCVATGEAIPPGSPSLRFVRDPGGVLTLDLSGKLPGRGAWISANRSHLLKALKKGAFARSFKDAVILPDGMTPEDYAEEIRHQLTRRTLNQLGLARRAGQCLCGFDVVKSSPAKLIAYLSPHDAAPDGVGKIARALEARGNGPHISLEIESAVLADAIGSPGAVHLGLLSGKAADAALYEATRLGQFTGRL